MTAPIRIQLLRRKGWRMPPNTAKVDRSTWYGNPFKVGMVGIPDNATAVRRFRRLMRRPQRDLAADHQLFVFTRKRIRAYLRGKNLACWCRLDQPCHADVLLDTRG
ncbi:MAG: DUF4326 domain-containing protein [Sulfuricaulis sp.]|nr:DUF4326 domain-containing protein [Sulfuricaulis sp.]